MKLKADLPETLVHTGQLAGLLDDDGSVSASWFQSDGADSIGGRGPALQALLGDLLKVSDANAEGLPGTLPGETWYAIPSDSEGTPSGVYIMFGPLEGETYLIGLGLRWSAELSPSADPSLQLRLVGRLPLFTANLADKPDLKPCFEQHPIELAVELWSNAPLDETFLSFNGLRVRATLGSEAALHMTLLDVLTPEGGRVDRELPDLGEHGGAWIELVATLLASRLQAEAARHLLPALGLGGESRIAWERWGERGAGVIRDWFEALVSAGTVKSAWLDHWCKLLKLEAAVDGSGTRLDPWRIGGRPGGARSGIYVTLAARRDSASVLHLFPGLWLVVADEPVGDDVCVAVDLRAELLELLLASRLEAGEAVPSLQAALRIHRQQRLLLNEDTGDAALGTVKIGSLGVGLSLSSEPRGLEPVFELIDVSCAQGAWTTLNLATEDAWKQVGAAAADTLAEKLEGILGVSSASSGAGRRIAALLGLATPASLPAGTMWPPALVFAADRLSKFVADPPRELACYHGRCLESELDGASAWRYLLRDLAELIRAATGAPIAITGAGREHAPWVCPLVKTLPAVMEGAELRAWFAPATHRLTLSLASRPRSIAVPQPGASPSTLSLAPSVDLLAVTLPDKEGSGPISARWLAGARAGLSLRGAPRTTTPEVGGMALSAAALSLAADWQRGGAVLWSIGLDDLRAKLHEPALGDLALPRLALALDGGKLCIDPGLKLEAPDFGLPAVDVPRFGALLRLTLGQWLLERGSFGFGLAGLFGLVAHGPALNLPALAPWKGGAFALPLDWPTLHVQSWPGFFASPWPDLRLHLGGLLREPRFALPALHWLAALWQGRLPDLGRLDLGWPAVEAAGGLPAVTGQGTYGCPWRIELEHNVDFTLSGLIWLEPDPSPASRSVGLGLQLEPAPQAVGAATISTVLRADLTRWSIEGRPAGPALALPRYTLTATLRPGAGAEWLVNEASPQARIRTVEIGLRIRPGEAGGPGAPPYEAEPMLRLYEATLDGKALPSPLELSQPAAGAPFGSTATLERLLDAALRAVAARARAADVETIHLVALLRAAGLVATDGGLRRDAWLALCADPWAYLRGRLRSVLADPAPGARAELLKALRGCLGLEGHGAGALLGADESEPTLAAREVLAELGLVEGAALGYALKPDAWAELLARPLPLLRARAAALLADESRAKALAQRLRAWAGGSARTLGPFSFVISDDGVVSLGCPACAPVSLGALRLHGQLGLDLTRRTIMCEGRLAPADQAAAIFPCELVLRASIETPQHGAEPQSSFTLHLAGRPTELGTTPYAPVQLYPLPEPLELRKQIGAVLLPFATARLAGLLLEECALPYAPEVAALLAALGVAHQAGPGAPWQARPLDGLIADPWRWLSSRASLGDAVGGLDPARVATAVQALAPLLQDCGAVGEAYGLAVAATCLRAEGKALAPAAPGEQLAGVRITLTSRATLADQRGDVALQWELALRRDGTVGLGGLSTLTVDLSADPRERHEWRASFGADGEALSLTIAPPDVAPIGLVPFAGWGALASVGAAGAKLLLPRLSGLLADTFANGASNPRLSKLGANLKQLAGALRLTEASSLSMLKDSTRRDEWLEERLNNDLVATLSALEGLVNDLESGVTATRDAARERLTIAYALPGAYGTLALALGKDDQQRLGVWLPDEQGHVDLGVVRVIPSASVAAVEGGGADYTCGLEVVLDTARLLGQPCQYIPEPYLRLGYGAQKAGAAYGPELSCGLCYGDDERLSVGILPQLAAPTEEEAREFALKCLLPLIADYVLQLDLVAQWLDAKLIDTVTPRAILTSATLLEDGHLKPLAQYTARGIVNGLLGGSLTTLSGVKELIPIEYQGDGAEKLRGCIKVHTQGKRYGLLVAIPRLTIIADQLDLIMGVASTGAGSVDEWLEGLPGATQPGLVVYLVEQGDGFSFAPGIELVDIGLRLKGKKDAPLVDSEHVRLGSVAARFYLNAGQGELGFGARADFGKLGLSLGALSGDDSVAKDLLKSDKGEPINPTFDLAIGYRTVGPRRLYIGLNEGKDVWLPVERAFGPIYLKQLGLRYKESMLTLLADGGLSVAMLSAEVDDLSLGIPLNDQIGDLKSWRLGLAGLGLAFKAGNVGFSGALLKTEKPRGERYDGMCVIEAAGRSFGAIGAYEKDEHLTSLYVFAAICMPIGGPPFFFVEGLAGGFGYNYDLRIPRIEEIESFTLVKAAMGGLSKEPAEAVRRMQEACVAVEGKYWVAVGLKFSTFQLLKAAAVLSVAFGNGEVDVNLLGLANLILPPTGTQFVGIEVALRAGYSSREQLFRFEALLTSKSWLFSEKCRLTGGMALYIWFGGEHGGEFVYTQGGYGPLFTPPSYYPTCDLIGVNFQPCEKAVLKGGTYFAITPQVMVGGGSLVAAYKDGDLEASFSLGIHALIQWKPFFFKAGAMIDVYARLWGFEDEIKADLWVWGPPFGGTARVEWSVLSFDAEFGTERPQQPPTANWDTFCGELLLPEPRPENQPTAERLPALFGARVESGLLRMVRVGEAPGKPPSEIADTPEALRNATWVVGQSFTLATETLIPATCVQLGPSEADRCEALPPFGIGPMAKGAVVGTHSVKLVRSGTTTDLLGTSSPACRAVALRRPFPLALWGKGDQDGEGEPRLHAYGGALISVSPTPEGMLGHPVALAQIKDIDPPLAVLPFGAEQHERGAARAGAPTTPTLRHLRAGLEQERMLKDGGYNRSGKGFEVLARALNGPLAATLRRHTLEQIDRLGVEVPTEVCQPLSSAYARRRSAPPVVASLYEGLDSDDPTPLEIRRRLVELDPEPVPEPGRPTPRLAALISRRLEPTRASAPAIRTTAAGLAAATGLRRRPLAELAAGTGPRGRLVRAPALGAPQPTGIAQPGAVVVRGATLAPAQADAFGRAEAQSLISVTSDKVSAALKALDPASPARTGVFVRPGQTIAWELEPLISARPALLLLASAGQVLRLTALDAAGDLLADLEFSGPRALSVPPRTARLLLGGLGQAGEAVAAPAMGAATSRSASFPVPSVGWQVQSELVRAGSRTLLGRGAVLLAAGAVGDGPHAGGMAYAVMQASEALAHQWGVETLLPPSVQSVALVLAGVGAREPGEAIAVGGLRLGTRPHLVGLGGRALLIYDVVVEPAQPFVRVGAAPRPGWRLEGVVGLQGGAAAWANTFAERPDLVDTLVEDGPITAYGVSRVALATLLPIHRPPIS